jgi:hypothetical protein
VIKTPRAHSAAHLDFIRQLPCIVCGNNICTEAAHIRFSCIAANKRKTGMGEKPHDMWVLPVCGDHHRAQHGGNEFKFWQLMGIDPIFSAMALWINSGNHEAGEQIVSSAREHTFHQKVYAE